MTAVAQHIDQDLQTVRLEKITEEYLALGKMQRSIQARESLLSFTTFMMPDFIVKWYHHLICYKLEQLLEGNIKKLMILMPPQHGKSEMSSRKFPAWALGKYPKLRFALISYAHTLSSKFNRQIQRHILHPDYGDVFPDIQLVEQVQAKKTQYVQNSLEFDIIGKGGSLISLGVGGGITGNPVDVGIIEDPFKDYEQASSPKIRQKIWDWYVDDYDTRLNNDARTLLINTRRHEDDLSGRLLEREPEEWEVVRIPAICEDSDKYPKHDQDPREIGEALFPEKHNLLRLLKSKKLAPRTFASLFQGRPAPAEGDILKRKWFKVVTLQELYGITKSKQLIHFVVDPAHEIKKESDPSGIMSYFNFNGVMYITNYKAKKVEFPDLLRMVQDFVAANGGVPGLSKIWIEGTASGKPLRTTLKKHTALSVLEDNSKITDKLVKANMISPICEAGRVVLLYGHWNEDFKEELCGFPNAAHDESLDCVYMMVSKTGLFGQFGLRATTM